MSDSIIKEPEKDPFVWSNLQNYVKNNLEIVTPIYKLAEENLYSWKNFELELPKTHFINKVELGFNNFNFESELSEIAYDENGNKKKLNKSQLQDISQTGQFQVESERFPNKFHTWKISKFLLKGTHNIYVSFRNDIIRGLRLIIMTSKNRLISRKLSAFSSCRHLYKGLLLLLDLLFGLPHNNHGNINQKLREELIYFLTCELIVTKENQSNLSKFWDFLEQVSCLPIHCNSITYIDNMNPGDYPNPVYQYTTPNNIQIDLRIAQYQIKKTFIRMVSQAISEIDNSLWFNQYKTNQIKKLFDENVSLQSMKEIITERSLQKQFNKIFKLLERKCSDNNIPESFCTMLVATAKFQNICETCHQSFIKELSNYLDAVKEKLVSLYPYRSLVSGWMRKKINKAQKFFITENPLKIYEMIRDECKKENLQFYEYFMSRIILFKSEREPLLKKQLIENSSFPDRNFRTTYKMVLPSQWKITSQEKEIDKVEYSLNKYRQRTWSTAYPFWRFVRYFQSVFVFVMVTMQYLLITLPFKTKVSYLAVFRRNRFYTKYVFSSKTGKLDPDLSSHVPTMTSRINKLWRHVWSSRRKFEQNSTTGLFDKRVARHFHRIWTVVLQGALGTFCLVTIFPVICLMISSGSCLLGLTAPLFAPIGALGWALIKITVYDLDCHDKSRNRLFRMFQAVVWHILLCGCFQLCLQLMLGLILCPMLAVLCVMWGCFRALMRYLWDSLIFFVIIRQFGNVPSGNDFVTRRIAGPGLAYSHKILIQPEHAIIVFLSYLEQLELDLWHLQMTNIIKKPLLNCRTFFEENFKYLGVKMDTNNEKIASLIVNEESNLQKARKLYYQRQDHLNISSFASQYKSANVKMASAALKETIEICTKLAEQFYRSRIQPRFTQALFTESGWWLLRNVTQHNYRELVIHSFTTLFNNQILSSIEACDEVYELQVNDITMNSYMDMFIKESYTAELMSTCEPIKSVSSYSYADGGPTSLDYCVSQLKDLPYPRVTQKQFFNDFYLSLPSKLKSNPCNKQNTFTGIEATRSLIRWTKGKGKGLINLNSKIDLIDYFQMKLCHPVIICALLHARDRDNTVLNLSHPMIDRVIDIYLHGDTSKFQRNYDSDNGEEDELLSDLPGLLKSYPSQLSIKMSPSMAEMSNCSLDESVELCDVKII